MKRQRGRNRNNNNRNQNNNPNRSMDSNGPDVKVRGNAGTIYEKYTALARDAQSSGNRVKAENLRQHAEHYLRVMNTQEAAKQAARAEAEAARAARGENNRTEDSETVSNEDSGSKPHRRNQRSRKPREDKAQNKVEANGLEVVTPEAETVKADNGPAIEPVAEEKPKRRRKAPTRKPAETETVDAAE